MHYIFMIYLKRAVNVVKLQIVTSYVIEHVRIDYNVYSKGIAWPRQYYYICFLKKLNSAIANFIDISRKCNIP